MDGEWPQYNSVVHNDLDAFMASEHIQLLQHDHGDDMYSFRLKKLVPRMDVSCTKLVLDTSIWGTSLGQAFSDGGSNW